MEESVLGEWRELLAFESIGADAAHLKECVSCASWLRKWLSKLGFEVELLYPGRGESAAEAKLPPPVVFAERKGDEGGSTVLVYGHYDVQPPDPLGEWKTPPFEPVVQDGRMYCRGANDDKGQTFALLCGMRDYLASEGRKINIKIVLDGQEESGSRALSELVPSLRRRLAADVLLVCDTSAAPDLRPAIVAGLRGVSHFTVNLTGPSRDLHSGEYGGISPNPAQGIAELVASLHLPDGSIAVAGFRDGIENPTHDELAKAEALGPSEESLEADIGCEPCGGQTGKTLVQRAGSEDCQPLVRVREDIDAPRARPVAARRICRGARASRGQMPEGDEALVRGCVRRHCRVQASARLAALSPCGRRPFRDGPARPRVPVVRRVDTGSLAPARGLWRGSADRRLGAGGRQDTLPERKLFTCAVRQGARMGAQDSLRPVDHG